jgi:hypothetical protein
MQQRKLSAKENNFRFTVDILKTASGDELSLGNPTPTKNHGDRRRLHYTSLLTQSKHQIFTVPNFKHFNLFQSRPDFSRLIRSENKPVDH